MYGLIGSLMVLPENRATLVEALLEGSADLPGCVSYVVAEDVEDESLVWVSEVWDSESSHAAALELPTVKESIVKARHVLIGFGPRHTLDVKGGYGVA
ncbi:MAG: antibiotic biosynthesis monooxygenase [Actinobacteria bacterium HGW-Actinobacteria-4]|nr:MAG: antibiotic biosynthesis monooxygenase [Actinobacteria bacterium HGW-Actinobacteria-4]